MRTSPGDLKLNLFYQFRPGRPEIDTYGVDWHRMMCELRHHFYVPRIHTKKNEQQVQTPVLVLISVFMDRVFLCSSREKRIGTGGRSALLLVVAKSLRVGVLYVF
jgi:hypothetical protein